MPKNNSTEKTRFCGAATVMATGTACNGRVAWESPFAVFTTEDGAQILWHSDKVLETFRAAGLQFGHAGKGARVQLDCRCRPVPHDMSFRVYRMSSLIPAALASL